MSTLLSMLAPVIETLGTRVQYDVVIWPIIVIGLAIILIAGAAIVFIIIGAVKLLKRLRKAK